MVRVLSIQVKEKEVLNLKCNQRLINHTNLEDKIHIKEPNLKCNLCLKKRMALKVMDSTK